MTVRVWCKQGWGTRQDGEEEMRSKAAYIRGSDVYSSDPENDADGHYRYDVRNDRSAAGDGAVKVGHPMRRPGIFAPRRPIVRFRTRLLCKSCSSSHSEQNDGEQQPRHAHIMGPRSNIDYDTACLSA